MCREKRRRRPPSPTHLSLAFFLFKPRCVCISQRFRSCVIQIIITSEFMFIVFAQLHCFQLMHATRAPILATHIHNNIIIIIYYYVVLYYYYIYYNNYNIIIYYYHYNHIALLYLLPYCISRLRMVQKFRP